MYTVAAISLPMLPSDLAEPCCPLADLLLGAMGGLYVGNASLKLGSCVRDLCSGCDAVEWFCALIPRLRGWVMARHVLLYTLWVCVVSWTNFLLINEFSSSPANIQKKNLEDKLGNDLT